MVFVVGVLRNTEPLDYAVKHNFILEVKAEDCGGRLSNKLLVNIVVKPACQNRWKGTSQSILSQSVSLDFYSGLSSKNYHWVHCKRLDNVQKG